MARKAMAKFRAIMLEKLLATPEKQEPAEISGEFNSELRPH
jgi:hypothetical protein